MITHGGESEMIYYRRLQCLGISEEYFYSLPYEYQKAIIMAGFDRIEKEKKKDDDKKRRALTQYELEENVKKKVLSIFKKK